MWIVPVYLNLLLLLLHFKLLLLQTHSLSSSPVLANFSEHLLYVIVTLLLEISYERNIQVSSLEI